MKPRGEFVEKSNRRSSSIISAKKLKTTNKGVEECLEYKSLARLNNTKASQDQNEHQQAEMLGDTLTKL